MQRLLCLHQIKKTTYNNLPIGEKMQIGMIGLGKMGANMAKRLINGGHSCVGFDINPANVENLVNAGGQGVDSLAGLVETLATPNNMVHAACRRIDRKYGNNAL